jgi:hypothetical protein
MDKINYILTYWLKLKLKQKEHNFHLQMSSEDHADIIKIYEEYEERKKRKKIDFSLLFNDNFEEVKNEQ